MKFLIADDHPLVRQAMALTLEKVTPGCTVLSAKSLSEALDIIHNHPDLDMFLLDLHMPDMNGLEGLKQARRALSNAPVSVISGDETSSSALSCLELGAAGYLPKSLPEDIMRAALALILAGGVYVPPIVADQALSSAANQNIPSPIFHHPGQNSSGSAIKSATLTPRQREVLELVIEGLSNKEIADRLELAEATVKVHMTAILRAYGVKNRAKAISAARHERDFTRSVG